MLLVTRGGVKSVCAVKIHTQQQKLKRCGFCVVLWNHLEHRLPMMSAAQVVLFASLVTSERTNAMPTSAAAAQALDELAAGSLQSTPCGIKRMTDPVRTFAALQSQGQSSRAHACLVESLRDGAVGAHLVVPWAVAAAEFTSHPAIKAHADAMLNNKPCLRTPNSYYVLGPFPIGKNEVDGDPVAAKSGSAFAHWLEHHNTSNRGQRWQRSLVASELAVGGRVSWEKIRTTPDGRLPVRWTQAQVPWGNLVEALGQRAVLEVQAWALGALAVVREGMYRLDCKGIAKVSVFNAASPNAAARILNADIYRSSPHGGGGFSVLLRPGAYVIAMRLRMVVEANPSCSLVKVKGKPFSIAVPQTVPDVVVPYQTGMGTQRAASFCGGFIALPVHNTGSVRWLRHLTVVGTEKGVDATIIGERFDVAPGQLRLLTVQLRLLDHASENARLACPFGTTIEVRGHIDGEDTPFAHKLRIGGSQCRTPEQSVVCTYVDHDGAVSAAAVIRPLRAERCDPTHGCPVLLTMHGTSIPVRDSADAYKHKPSGAADSDGYIFGVDRFWVIAPTRHGAHNWETGGRLTAMHAVDALARLPDLPTSATIDTQRVLYCGHSMGGHGAWMASVQGASRALGVAAVSGWLKKETYGDSNFLFDQSVSDVSASYVEPALEGLLRASIGDNNLELHLPILHNVPYLARTGTNDRTVPSFWARRAQRVMESLGPSQHPPRLSELKGKEHWWWDTERANDGGALNDDEMRAFFNSTLRGAEGTRPALPELPEEFVLVSHSPAAFDGRAGWRIVQFQRPARMASARIIRRATTAGPHLDITTRNIRRLLVPASEVVGRSASIDGTILTANDVKRPHDTLLELCSLRDEAVAVGTPPGRGKWRICSPDDWRPAERGPETAGPMRQIAHSPFAIIAGGGGAIADDAADLQELSVFLANLFLVTSDRSPAVYADVEVLAEDGISWKERHVKNWILMGGPRQNAASAAVFNYWKAVGHAASWSDTGMLMIDKCKLPSAGMGALILGPHPSGGLALIVDGDVSGRRDAIAAVEPTIPPMARSPFSNTLPDFIVTGPSFAAKGYGGLLAAGFFDYRWRWSSPASYVAFDCE